MTYPSARALCCAMVLLLSACAPALPPRDDADPAASPARPGPDAATRAMYAAVEDGGRTVPAIDPAYLSEARKRQEVAYFAPHPPGTLVVDPGAKRLYRLLGDDRAMRYTVAVGAAGYGFSGEATVPYTRDWPGWTPTQNMIRREPGKYAQFAGGVEGGLDNPLGARALYLFRDGRDTLYRIHGTPSPWTIGQDASSGCIRMFNQDVMHLADEVDSGTRVIVLPRGESGRWTSPSSADPTRPEPTGDLP
ncbi:L,D-transpeptidase [Roseivivax isoporae]|uniref:L,D-TPase catalytic domain-containing protein n=1 Tax=Roseivivax isoporae LMG 25204 TaxID=1449351 RepID=X7F2Q4_9RHOB|nr:L,D-transpeptidase [Roseivivax isoporae]ETX27040.1 hypothetical protein RISW2_16970 [Roseivivax isoporae LMG 25204]